jgi:hypothetical protein
LKSIKISTLKEHIISFIVLSAIAVMVVEISKKLNFKGVDNPSLSHCLASLIFIISLLISFDYAYFLRLGGLSIGVAS